jgi:transposase
MRVDGKNRRLLVKLTRRDSLLIAKLLQEAREPLNVRRRAQVLLMLHAGKKPPYVASHLQRISAKGVRGIGWRYCEEGLQSAIYGKRRVGQPRKITQGQRSAILAMASGPPPAEYRRWTVRLIAAEVMHRGITVSISREAVRLLLKKEID